MKASTLLQEARDAFFMSGFEAAEIEAGYLLEEVTGSRWAVPDRELAAEQERKAYDYLARRLNHEPYQYICGWAQFRELKLHVAPGCLIPRAETEFLVDYILKELPPDAWFCELGTGSGAIALSVAFERPDTTVFASELSPDALKIAQLNLMAHRLANASLLHGDLLAPLPQDSGFDVLAANLPYIPESERENLPQNVREFEPGMALFAPDSGMSLIKRALKEAPPYLKPGARLFFEMGEEQGAPLADFAASLGCYTGICVLPDQYGIPRFLKCTFSAP